MEYLISLRGEDVNFDCGNRGTPLHAASRLGHLNAVSVLLLDHGANLNKTDYYGQTVQSAAYDGRHLEVMQVSLDRGAPADVWHDDASLLIHIASFSRRADALRLLIQHGADINATDKSNRTPLRRADTLVTWTSCDSSSNTGQTLASMPLATMALP
jgi:hypothetical protein